MSLSAALLLVIGAAISSPAVAAELSLADAIIRAQKHNFAVSAARHDSAAAAAEHLSASRDRFPVVSLKAQSFYVDDVPAIELPMASMEIGSHENYQTDITVSVPIYTGGRLSSRIALQEKNLQAESMRLETERMAVAYRTRAAYLGVLNGRTLVQSATASLRRVQIIQRNVGNLFENGMADSLDLLEAELAVEAAGRQLDHAETESQNAMVALARLIGADEKEIIDLSEDVPPPDTLRDPEMMRAPIPVRPELKRMEYLTMAADDAARMEFSGYLPLLNGFVGYSYGKPNRDWFESSWNDYFTAGLALTWEFNLGGRAARDVDAARQRATSARLAKREVYDRLVTVRDIALNDLRHAFGSYRRTRAEYDLAQRRFELAELQQAAGRMSVNRLLELEAELTATEQQHRASIYTYYLAENDLLYAIGSSRIFGGLR